MSRFCLSPFALRPSTFDGPADPSVELPIAHCESPPRHAAETNPRAAVNTSSNIASVKRPVNVFCWLG